MQAELDGNGVLWAGKTIQPSQKCTIRLIVLKDNGSAAARQSVLEVFHRFGPSGEGIEQYRIVGYLACPAGGGPIAHPQAPGTRGGRGVVALGRRVCHCCLGSHGSRLRKATELPGAS
ncbi:hypothetical protein ABZX40_26820 [Streptomyces sp. NPDC004610]|uniref:hypothetical protein n=1 Tax=Streptomyces sp. NPDC004610 TaxID=3154668 RepID=UPI0033A99591